MVPFMTPLGLTNLRPSRRSKPTPEPNMPPFLYLLAYKRWHVLLHPCPLPMLPTDNNLMSHYLSHLPKHTFNPYSVLSTRPSRLLASHSAPFPSLHQQSQHPIVLYTFRCLIFNNTESRCSSSNRKGVGILSASLSLSVPLRAA